MEQNKSKSDLIADYYSQHYDELKAYVCARLQHAEEGEDIVQNVFVRLLQMDKMITQATLPCLVYTVAKNLICDYWRHRQYVEGYEHIIQRGESQVASVQDVESVYSVREMTELLERGIARLSEKQRKVYRLNVYDGLQVGEIAAKLDINYKNAENRLGAARRQVRGYMRRMLA